MVDILKNYETFVEGVTSNASNDLEVLITRLRELQSTSDVNIALLDTAASGLGAEGGEFQEIVKKIKFQGKPLGADEIFHMKRELGDIIWYWSNACRALNLDPNDVISENVKKLEGRFPGGKFDVFHSQNRKSGDI